MNKLISRNPVQRFKQGRKIIKAEPGWKLDSYTGRYRNPITRQSLTKEQYKQYKLDKLRKAGYIDDNNHWIGSTATQDNKSQRPSSTSRRPLKTKEQWESEFNNAKNKLTAQQLMYLDSLGINTSSAEKMQQGINAYNKDSGLVVDDKWGDKSSAALSKILSSMPSNYRNEDTQQGLDNEKNIPDPTKPVTNLGYRTSNTYENNDFSDRLKNMGIRSNADLINFMYRTNGENYNWNGDNWAKQFRSDVNQALGGNYSDANIRKVFNTQGNWGKGFLGGGDIRDFQNTLQTNAGIWNGSYDKKQQEADLLSRTGQNGTVYSNSHAKDLFDKIKLNNYVPFMNQLTNISNASLGIKTPGYANWGTLLNNRFSYYKIGGQLPSRNIVKRFKQRNFRLVAQ